MSRILSGDVISLAGMKATARFTVSSFKPAPVEQEAPINTALPVSVATMIKVFEGEAEGRSATVFTSAYDQESTVGTYLAMESFEGSLNGARGSFNFIHAAATTSDGRPHPELFSIVASSGTGELQSIRGAGGLTVDDDGVHRVWFDYELD